MCVYVGVLRMCLFQQMQLLLQKPIAFDSLEMNMNGIKRGKREFTKLTRIRKIKSSNSEQNKTNGKKWVLQNEKNEGK